MRIRRSLTAMLLAMVLVFTVSVPVHAATTKQLQDEIEALKEENKELREQVESLTAILAGMGVATKKIDSNDYIEASVFGLRDSLQNNVFGASRKYVDKYVTFEANLISVADDGSSVEVGYWGVDETTIKGEIPEDDDELLDQIADLEIGRLLNVYGKVTSVSADHGYTIDIVGFEEANPDFVVERFPDANAFIEMPQDWTERFYSNGSYDYYYVDADFDAGTIKEVIGIGEFELDEDEMNTDPIELAQIVFSGVFDTDPEDIEVSMEEFYDGNLTYYADGVVDLGGAIGELYGIYYIFFNSEHDSALIYGLMFDGDEDFDSEPYVRSIQTLRF